MARELDIVEYSEKCIKKYLDKYGFRLKITEEFGPKGVYKGTIIMKRKDDPKFGIVKYEFDNGEKDLYISDIYMSDNKHGITVSLMRVILLYLFSYYSNRSIEYIRLNAVPTYENEIMKDSEKYLTKGIEKGYCLSCYYQKLGFEPIESDLEKLSKMIDMCLTKLGPSYTYRYPLCVLCDCQRKINVNDIKLEGFKPTAMEITMERLLPNLKQALKDAYRQIKEECK